MAESGSKGFSRLLLVLRSNNLWFHGAHHSAKGPSFLSDHKLYGQMYEAYALEYDTAAEKAVTCCGDAISDPLPLARESVRMLEHLPQPSALTPLHLAQAALQIERSFQAHLVQCRQELSAGQALTLGVDNFLSQCADNHEVFLYKLGQRVKAGG